MTPLLLTLAWRPFLDPIELHAAWHPVLFLPPLVVAIALVYKALKMPSLQHLLRETVYLSLYIIALMVVAAIFLRVLIEFV